MTGIGGLSLTPAPVYTGNINAGAATAAYSFPGDPNHSPSDGSQSFTIAKADAACSITGFSGAFDALPKGASGSCLGAVGEAIDGLSLGQAFSNVPGGLASWALVDPAANYNPQSGAVAIVIDLASSSTTLSCPTTVTYTGSALTPCSVSVTGDGHLNLTPAPAYTANIEAATVAVSYSFSGDTNHAPSGASTSFVIQPAPSTTTVTCAAGPFTYTGSAHEPCTVSVTGAGGLNVSPSPQYSANIDAGTVTASYSYVGDLNHTPSSHSTTFVIQRAPSSTVVACGAGPFRYNGTPQTPCSATVTGIGGLSLTPAPVYTGNTNAGAATAAYSFPGDPNHTPSSHSTSFVIQPAPSIRRDQSRNINVVADHKLGVNESNCWKRLPQSG